MHLQPLFTAPIQRQTLFEDVHPGQASDVWLVETAMESVVVRRSRIRNADENVFWWGCKCLFGVNPTDVSALSQINRALSSASPIPVPQVLRQAVIAGETYVVVEKMEGQTLRTFHVLSPEAMFAVGKSIASIHSRTFAECGTLSGRLTYPVSEFHRRLVSVMQGLIARFYADSPEISSMLKSMCDQALALPEVTAASLVMMDMDPTQYLWDGTRITALVDTEVYVMGPRELELVSLEYLLDEKGAKAFVSGYETVLPLPDLRTVRSVYRYFCRLIEVQGGVEIDKWMGWPEWFG